MFVTDSQQTVGCQGGDLQEDKQSKKVSRQYNPVKTQHHEHRECIIGRFPARKILFRYMQRVDQDKERHTIDDYNKEGCYTIIKEFNPNGYSPPSKRITDGFTAIQKVDEADQ